MHSPSLLHHIDITSPVRGAALCLGPATLHSTGREEAKGSHTALLQCAFSSILLANTHCPIALKRDCDCGLPRPQQTTSGTLMRLFAARAGRDDWKVHHICIRVHRHDPRSCICSSIVMSSTLAERCFGLHRQQGQAALALQYGQASKGVCSKFCEDRAAVPRRKPQHLSQRSHKRAGNAVCAYQRTAIAPPRGGTFPLPIDYTQVISHRATSEMSNVIATPCSQARRANICTEGGIFSSLRCILEAHRR